MRSYIGYRVGQQLAVRLPLPAAYWLAERLADLQAWQRPADRATVEANLACILGRDRDDVAGLRRDVFRGFARYLVEFFRLGGLRPSPLDRWIAVEGRQHLDAAQHLGRGAVLVSAHFGHWELGGAALGSLGYPVTVVALDHANPRVNRLFVRWRERFGIEVIRLGGSMRRCIAALEAGRLLGLVGDQQFGRGGVAVRLCGRDVLLPRGPAWLSLRQQVPLLPTFVVRADDGRYRLIIEPPLAAEPSGEAAEDARRLTQAYAAVLERYLRAYPAQWYLFERLWARADVR